MKDMWNNRFGGENYIYGKKPNSFMAEALTELTPGKILFVGEGEGRNSVYAAKLGWNVDAVDYSDEGKKKAERLASENGVQINYSIIDLAEFEPEEGAYDAIVNIYIHLPPELRTVVHKKLISALKPGGEFIFEAFEKDQLKYNSGGPKIPELLYSMDELVEDFIDLDFVKFGKEIINLDEGLGHEGKGAVIRFIGVKK